MKAENPETSERRHTSGRLRWLLDLFGVCFVVALLIGVPFAMLQARHQRTRLEIQKRLDAIRAAGQPLTAQDLAKLYPDPPPDKDASLLLKPALELLTVPDVLAEPDESTNLLFFDVSLPRSGSLDPPVLAEGRKWLDRNQAAFALIPWSKLEGAWVGSGFTNGFDNLTEAPLSKMSHLVRLLCLNAVLQAEQQHPHEAVMSLQQAAVIGNTLKNDLPVHFLVRAMAQSIVSRSLQRVLNRVNLPDADLVSFPNFLTLTNIGATRESWIISKRPDALFAADLLESQTSQLTKGVVSPLRRVTSAFKGEILYHVEDLLQYLDWSDHCLAALDSPVTNAISTLRNIEKLQDDAVKNKHVLLDVFKTRRFSLLSMEEPKISGAFLIELKVVAQVRVAVAALAVERWRFAHGGQVPGSFAELAPNFLPAVPADPFDGQPLRYKKLAGGYVIYSIGEDFADDGGKEEDPNVAGGNQHYDITFTVDK
jgi:hypothetical protein